MTYPGDNEPRLTGRPPSDTVRVNGVECEPGCWVEGHWGQYGPDHLADKIDGLIELEPLDDPRILRQIAETTEGMGYHEAAAGWWEIRTEATDRITERLNDVTPDGWVWDWVDGEFFLMPVCDDDETCTDETCAHWRYA